MAKIFLSHSAHDAVLARLICHLCQPYLGTDEIFLAERDIRPGAQFDAAISEAINRSKLLLVLWTSHAASSPWVNQEVGIALGCRVPVWPIAIEDMALQGAVFRNQGSYLARHAEPHTMLRALAEQMHAFTRDGSFQPRIDEYLIGKTPRTLRLVELLTSGLEGNRWRKIRIRSAFSIFAVSAEQSYRRARRHTKEYHALLVQELEALNPSYSPN